MIKQNDIMVSVCCVTYNHEEFIEDCLDGFLKQKVNFPIEIIIHDDASTDNTQTIIKTYAKRDERIKPILRKDNIKSKGVPVFPLTYEVAQGKYIALCEGDDYWTDPLKLQKQVDFLDNNKDYVAHCHNVFFRDERSIENKERLFSNLKSRDLIIKDICPTRTFHTASLIFRAYLSKEIIRNLSERTFLSGDKYLYLFLFSNGKFFYDEQPWAFYRRHIGGLSTSNDLDTFLSSDIKLFKFFHSQMKDYELKVELTEAVNYYRVERFKFLLGKKISLKLYWCYINLFSIINKSKYLSFKVFKKLSKKLLIKLFY